MTNSLQTSKPPYRFRLHPKSEAIERWYPTLLAPIGVIVVLFIRQHFHFSLEQRMSIFNAAISIATIFFGFVGTALAIVLSFVHHRIFRRLTDRRQDELLISYMTTPLYGCSAVIMCSLTMIGFWGRSREFDSACLAMFGFSAFHVTLALWRLQNPIATLVRVVGEEENARQAKKIQAIQAAARQINLDIPPRESSDAVRPDPQ